jgi:hypothetical protein
MAEWSKLMPPAGDAAPAQVEAAWQAVEALRAKVQPARQAFSDAQAAATEAAAADRERMAGELRAGRSPKADATGLAKAEARVAGARRQAEALQLAIADSESELGRVVHERRERWLADAQRQENAARSRARELIAELRGALEDWASVRGVTHWLEPDHGLDREHPAPPAIRAGMAGSERFAANGEPLALTTVCDMLTQTVAEPEPGREQRTPVPV